MKKLKSNPSKTVLVITVGFLVLYLIFENKYLLNVGIIVGILGVLSGWISQKIEWFWFKLTYVLSLIVPNVLLGVIFYLILTPIAFFAGLAQKTDTLQIKKPEVSSFSTVNKKYSPSDLKNPW